MKMNTGKLRSVILSVVVALFASVPGFASEYSGKTFVVDVPTCESQLNPIGVNTLFPRFGWIVKGNEPPVSYQIVVSTSAEEARSGKGKMWNSGIVKSDQNSNVLYAGKRLKAGIRYYWAVRVFDKKGVASKWSRLSWFEIVYLSPKEWSV